MLKKYKILMLAIVLTATGVILVLSVWLYGSYQTRKQYYLGSAERELFDVIQGFYQDNEAEIQRDNQNQRRGRIDRFSTALKKRYPMVDIDTVKGLFESENFWRRPNNDKPSTDTTANGRAKMSRHFISSFVFRNINWSEEVLDTLAQRLSVVLKQRDMDTPFKLHMLNLPDEQERDASFYHGRFKENKSRPILVDPGDNLYLELDFDNPWRNIVMAIFWQICIVILLICLLIGTFFYLLDTIKKQNQLAKMRKAFVNNMTHELKTPVSTVMAAVESIQRFGAKDDKERMNRYLAISRNELEHLSDMIERVLQIDVAETNGLVLDKSSFDIVLLLKECVENAQLFAKKAVQVTWESNVESYTLMGDMAHIKNVFNNLLDNAIKYAEETVQLNIRVQASDKEIEIQIQDNGIGIPKAYQKGVFDLFFRVPSGNIHNVKGFGLGLAYVRQIVTQHQGQVQVKSEEGLGSTFIVTLPKD
ncbi:hypothetical protein GCM10022216_07520 [Sphingobacterium kyonggiense]|uniref:histidine kinase n=1 Tax=Sphingobacterium kyonggiense TaxID=714075 RepID=A0ABP7YDS6_9SPHI